ncbi:hypothetical protein [Streptomyces clavuligerus]|uniref:Uncharacterized protein n=1 Tax=Streptomyces clavuligerus TaxID=1901 RepID=D5SIR3_STRCL|nr:hypothetical protein [Streptomyces clavuligerus]EFG03806.1 Hypothetical protein SCLAV_p0315 [Streptomyces clavuligerus]MBY6307668.1 hypothetical protein [Streptomyces clavuligerus]WDN56489.1 hypothetical protein LL058_32150 [Streptomyces clavuligerus]
MPTGVDPGLDPAEQRLLADADRKIRAACTTVRHHTETEQPPYTTRITTAGHTVTVTSHQSVVTAWSAGYFDAWWNTITADVAAGYGEPVVTADVDPAERAQLTAVVHDQPHEQVLYAGSALAHRREVDGTVIAAQPGQHLAFRYGPATRRLRVAGDQGTPVATAAARLACELLRGWLLADGWQILHASAADRDGDTVLTLGGGGARGRASPVLLVRGLVAAGQRPRLHPPRPPGRHTAGPAVASGGRDRPRLLDALGLSDGVRERTLSGQRLHPTQHGAPHHCPRRGLPCPAVQREGQGTQGPVLPRPARNLARDVPGHRGPGRPCPLPPPASAPVPHRPSSVTATS